MTIWRSQVSPTPAIINLCARKRQGEGGGRGYPYPHRHIGEGQRWNGKQPEGRTFQRKTQASSGDTGSVVYAQELQSVNMPSFQLDLLQATDRQQPSGLPGWVSNTVLHPVSPHSLLLDISLFLCDSCKHTAQ